MKFALSKLAAPQWDLPTLMARATEFGFDGVELPAAHPGMTIACFATDVFMPHDARGRAKSSDELKRHIESAANAGCKTVRVLASAPHTGLANQAGAIRLADWLLPLGDVAAGHDVTLVVENSMGFQRARDLWMTLDTLSHPNVAACWNLHTGLLAKELPALAVPVLNSRIQYTRISDTAADHDFIKPFLIRLLGIGYKGFVTLERIESGADPAVRIPATLEFLRQCIKPPADPKAKHLKKEPVAIPK